MSRSRESAENASLRFQVFVQRIRALFQPFVEIARGISSGSIPYDVCSMVGILAAVVLVTRLDYVAFAKLGLNKFYPHISLLYYPYAVTLLLSGYLLWGLAQSLVRMKLAKRIGNVLALSGIRNKLGHAPRFVSDIPLDKDGRKLILTNAGLPLKTFLEAREALESGLRIYIDEIKEKRKYGVIELSYAYEPMPTQVSFAKELIRTGPCRFVIGRCRSHPVICDLRETPHLLVAGITGGGKSTFLRQMIVTLLLKNRNLNMTLIDLKDGLEFGLFENINRIRVLSGLQSTISRLESYGSVLSDRMALLKHNRCKDIEAFLKIPAADRKLPRGVSHDVARDLDRHVIVVDEAADLFLANPLVEARSIQKARRLLNEIARKGRAVGLHLVIATQRPDTKALDSQIKANLPGILCFRMVNDASSISVLGDGTATEIPEIKGRAIWRSGSEAVQLQTPFLDVAEAETLLEPHRQSLVVSHGELADSPSASSTEKASFENSESV